MSKQKITENMNRWLSSFSEDTSNNICNLYDEKATLWGTVSPIKRNTTALIKDYFDQVFIYKNRYIELNDSNIRLFGDIAICNGFYTFRWVKEGENITTVARFSFVYMKKGKDWTIIEHHSSTLPVVV